MGMNSTVNINLRRCALAYLAAEEVAHCPRSYKLETTFYPCNIKIISVHIPFLLCPIIAISCGQGKAAAEKI